MGLRLFCMDQYFQKTLQGGATEADRRYGTAATLNGKAVEIIADTETIAFGFSDGDASADRTLDVILSVKSWLKYKVARVTSNSIGIEGTTYQVKSAKVLPGAPTVRLTLHLTTT